MTMSIPDLHYMCTEGLLRELTKPRPDPVYDQWMNYLKAVESPWTERIYSVETLRYLLKDSYLFTQTFMASVLFPMSTQLTASNGAYLNPNPFHYAFLNPIMEGLIQVYHLSLWRHVHDKLTIDDAHPYGCRTITRVEIGG